MSQLDPVLNAPTRATGQAAYLQLGRIVRLDPANAFADVRLENSRATRVAALMPRTFANCGPYCDNDCHWQPAVGHRVLLGHINGDPHKPIVLGPMAAKPTQGWAA